MRQFCSPGGFSGDAFVLEAHWSPDFRKRLRTIYWAARSRAVCEPLFLKAYPNVKHINLCPDEIWRKEDEPGVENRTRCFFDVMDLCERLPKLTNKVTREDLLTTLEHTEDWSIIRRFPTLTCLPFYGSSFLKTKLATIKRLKLPKKYLVSQPYTLLNPAGHRAVRDFRPENWEWLKAFADNLDLAVVVLNQGPDPVPDWTINLSNKTSFAEGVEVLKGAGGYYGIDSCFSVLAAELFDDDHLRIIARNTFYHIHKECYARTQADYDKILLR